MFFENMFENNNNKQQQQQKGKKKKRACDYIFYEIYNYTSVRIILKKSHIHHVYTEFMRENTKV